MKKILQFCFLLLIGATAQKKKKVIFFGDSITESGAKSGGFILKIDSISQKK